MLQEITIKNFKSIADDTIELGRVNVFIGENGCGKSNILEAVGFVSALENGKVELESLRNKGIRIAKPSLMLSSFSSKKQVKNIIMDLFFSDNEKLETIFFAETVDDIYTNWIEKNTLEKSNKLTKFANSKLQGMTLIDEPELLLNRKNKELKEFINILNEFNIITENEKYLHQFLIYTLNTPSLRGLVPKQTSNNIYGEGLDILIANFDKNEQNELKEYNYLISWLDDYLIDTNDILKFKGFKQNLSQSKLYFADKHNFLSHLVIHRLCLNSIFFDFQEFKDFFSFINFTIYSLFFFVLNMRL